MKKYKRAKGDRMYRPGFLQITPRHLLFNLMAYHEGNITRKELYNDILEAGSILSRKGYKIPLNIKSSPDGGYCSDNIDGEIFEWSRSGIIKEKGGHYSFSPKEKPFDSISNILNILNDSLKPKTLNNLEKAIKQMPHRE